MRFFRVFLLCVISAAALNARQPAKAKQNGAGTSTVVFFDALDGQGWQYFFAADALKKKIPSMSLEIWPLAHLKEGQWTSPRGEGEIKETARIMALKEKNPSKLFAYLTARSLSPWPDGWRDSMIFAGISPTETEAYAQKNKEVLLKKAFEKSEKSGISSSAMFINGKEFTEEPRLLSLLKKINEDLPAGKKMNLFENEKPDIKTPAFFMVVSSATDGWQDERIMPLFKRYFPEIKAARAFYSPEKFPGLKMLPAYAIEDTDSVREALGQAIAAGYFEKSGKYLIFYNKEGKNLLLDRKEDKGRLDIFVMAQCPFGVMAENAVLDALNKGSIDKKTRFNVNYIADALRDEKGALSFKSLHGEQEWQEDARQVFIASVYPDKFLAYLAERNKNYQNPLWQESAKKAGLDPAKIDAGSEKGKQLLEENIKTANSLGIGTSPTFVVDGNIMVVGIGGLMKFDAYKKINPRANTGGEGCKQ